MYVYALTKDTWPNLFLNDVLWLSFANFNIFNSLINLGISTSMKTEEVRENKAELKIEMDLLKPHYDYDTQYIYINAQKW